MWESAFGYTWASLLGLSLWLHMLVIASIPVAMIVAVLRWWLLPLLRSRKTTSVILPQSSAVTTYRPSLPHHRRKTRN